MGKIRHMLGLRKISPRSGYEHFVMEAAENIHAHWRDTRIQILPEDFKKFSEYVNNAYIEWVKIGYPITDKQNFNLGSPIPCKNPGYFCNRMTIEEQEVGGIHIHWRDTRIHADYGHFSEFATMVNEAYLNFKNIHKKRVKLDDLEYPAIADVYLKWLQEYKNGKLESVDPNDCAKICVEKNKCLAYDSEISIELDKKVLFSIYESISKYGYASGPYYGNYIVCWLRTDGSIYMAAAHRWASLKTLGYNDIDICVIPVPDPAQIREQ